MAGTLVISTLSDGTNSTSSTNCIQGSAKAWVNFDNSNSTIRASYNVSSITRNGTGDSTVNYTNAFSDANYSCVVTAVHSFSAGNADVTVACPKPANGGANPQTTTSVRVVMSTHTSGLSYVDAVEVNVAIFR